MSVGKVPRSTVVRGAVRGRGFAVVARAHAAEPHNGTAPRPLPALPSRR
jgi:hypothetical protein